MSTEQTIQAVRLALGVHEMQARVAGTNIANASRPDARAMRVDFAGVQAALARAASDGSDAAALTALQEAAQQLRSLSPAATGEGINLDEEVSRMVVASGDYQALTEALSRQFALMRLSITGRS